MLCLCTGYNVVILKQQYILQYRHWNCPDSTTLSGCQGAQSASMALKNFGSKPGAVTFWSTVSKKYANNPLVFYELFNEPWIGLNQFTAYVEYTYSDIMCNCYSCILF